MSAASECRDEADAAFARARARNPDAAYGIATDVRSIAGFALVGIASPRGSVVLSVSMAEYDGRAVLALLP